MPSPIGHALAGISIAQAAGAKSPRRPRHTALAATCAVLAALADIDLLVPGAHRTATHSVTATILVTIVAIGVTGWVTGRIDWRIGLICGAAYGSHLVLDWLAQDPVAPYGIQALWPFSREWFISGWNIFPPTERRRIFSAASLLTNLRAAAQEIAIVGPIVLLTRRRKSRGRTSGRDVRP